MTGGWAATNTLRQHELAMWGAGSVTLPSARDFDAAIALVETALDAAQDYVDYRGAHYPRKDALAAALRAVREGA